MAKRIDVYAIGAKAKFQEWISKRGGVQIWENVDLSNLDRGGIYTPALAEDGQPCPKPHWAYIPGAISKSLDDFRFVKELKEVKRVKIALDKRLHGMTIRLTGPSSERVRKACRDIEDEYGIAPTYHFEDLEAVIEVPVMED